jgi:zinc transport system permease protein
VAGLLSFGFLQRALLAGVFIGLACALLGVFLVLRKDAMVGHGLSHVTFAGVALGLFLNVMPLSMALLTAVLAALGLMKLKERAGLYGDTAVGIISSVGLALGILLATLSHSFNVALFSYLFGEILAIENLEVWLTLGLAMIVLAAVLANYRGLLFLTFDPDSARASGIKTSRLESLLAVLTAVTIVLGMKVVGILLVASLLIIPAAAGLQLARRFRQALLLAAVASFLSVVGGILAAFVFDLPASATIVLLSFVLFVAAFLGRRVKGTA